tara:strand:- start:44 stop:793 length:750 start_codon:yes stop_codon:yes gene_type:complete
MDKTAGHMMGYMGLMDDDAKMLCKVLEISAAQALSLKKKIKMGHKLPSWAEYKIYKAGDALKSAMASTHSMRDHMPKITIAIKSGPSMGGVLPSNMNKTAGMGINTGFTAQMMSNSGGVAGYGRGGMMGAPKMNMPGMPSYDKGGPIKKDGYLTDKKGKPYARVHKGEKVVPKDEKTKKAWAKLASPNASGMSYLNTKKAPLKTQDGKRLYRTGNVNDRNYKLRARENLVADPNKVKRTIRSAAAYVGN